MARPQEAPQEPPFRLRIHPRCGNTPLFPSSSGGSRPQLPAARLPPRAQRPPPPSPGKDRAPPGPGRGGAGLLASPFPLQGVYVGAGGGGQRCRFPSGVCARHCRRPLPARPLRSRLLPAGSAAAGRMRCPARPARPPGNPGSVGGREERREYLLRAAGAPSVAEGTAPSPRSRPGGVRCAGPGGGCWHGASAPRWEYLSWDQLCWKTPQTPSSPAYDRTIALSITPWHQLPCPVFPYIPPARVTAPPPQSIPVPTHPSVNKFP
ncbi:protein VASP homolog [Haemorhous mexicanus]|uniref:protein VASP homolog n=1 Tax=Haemorhous mexicanus TaxID=30427 RepID=UPI0028BD14B9|nr:protein VASP homolog [Haemorhous mexicanus]